MSQNIARKSDPLQCLVVPFTYAENWLANKLTILLWLNIQPHLGVWLVGLPKLGLRLGLVLMLIFSHFSVFGLQLNISDV